MSTANVNSNSLSGTVLVHGDRGVHYSKAAGGAISPAISVSTTFRTAHPDENVTPIPELQFRDPERHVYSRYTQEVSGRAEQVLSKILNGYAITYPSGLSAAYSALIHYQPKRIAVRGGYHGCHESFVMYQKSRSDAEVIDLDADYKPGDLCWLETPVNPYGESRDIQYYAEKIHQVGGKLIVDSTFAPPPLQDPFRFGADCILHSGTKYLGGHSDLLCGVLVVKNEEEWNELWNIRTFTGCSMGSLEAWLLLRSLKTLHLRVPRQSETATVLAKWLQSVSKTASGQSFEGIPGGLVKSVWHSSLQGTDARGFNPQSQMTGGYNPTFSIALASPELASKFAHMLEYFMPATSLGGVESLVEHRRGTDPNTDPKLVRLSIGVEELDDLKADLRQALQKLGEIQA
ncbi:hypothetical protein AGABI1DRAFT_73517 [Agaricus bisporus var. burnettii JB137-S8]|uniref:Cystathionine gamma-synthase n=1 Tax=Agaricus bisporus var. burnettii (strain JB137-S8 / ATCC MYA-4627 / FGSC 10392) TaxID=597362 RepID=K5W0Q1_AGABU|nr:uncharacterized protein AGABI1DRAFT_73517 [Agaricus bisporus var. burnettii JB137-S8]EKM80374.1 hypothetical protein AGABI1DRAFT_73517 [Agaricus bisporus var. burnettii JB137-S8]